jgi:hypothetical protein
VSGSRYSVIPAAAVTDPRLEPQDLQLLCLLGRHTDQNGWCRRSQVRTAEELRRGRATIQRSLNRLHQAGYLQRRLEGRRNREPPTEGEQPFRAHSYRMIMDHEAADDGLEQHAEMQASEHGVPVLDGQGCPDIRGHL